MTVTAHAALAARRPLELFTYEPEPLGSLDVEIAISHCGLCHTDVSLIDGEWGTSRYPLVPGHEIVGRITLLGRDVADFREGDRVGVGYQSGSDHTCEWCQSGQEHVCPNARATCVHGYGGYADAIRIDSRFVHRIPDGLPSEAAAPLLCAGVTVYAPLRSAGIGPSMSVGVIGIGGLGHLALQFARAMGADVTALSSSPRKKAEAERFGARHFIATNDSSETSEGTSRFDMLLSTVSANLDWTAYLGMLRPNGTLCIVGFPTGQIRFSARQLIGGEKRVIGSHGGSPADIREMLRFAELAGVRPQTQLMPMRDVNRALDHARRNEVRYRIVLSGWDGD